MKFKTYIFDFDNTLFDTNGLRRDMFSFIASLGIPRQEVDDAYVKLKGGEGYDYGLEIHLALIGKLFGEKKVDWRRVNEYKARPLDEYVWPDARETLQGLKSAGCRLVLFTKGNLAFQRLKLEKSGLVGFFNEVVVVNPLDNKEDDLARIPDFQGACFVNDNWPETRKVMIKFPGLHCVLFISPNHADSYYEAAVDIQKIKNLKELIK